MRKKKLFFITHLLPYPLDMANKVRMFHIIKSLSEYFHITLVSQVLFEKELIHVQRFNEICDDIFVSVAENKKSVFHRLFYKGKYWFYYFMKGMPKDQFYANYCGLQKLALQLLKNNQYDVCFFEYWFWPELLDWASGLQVVDTNDVQYQRLEKLQQIKNKFRNLHRRQLENYRRQEIMTLCRYDMIITVTDKDKKELERELHKNKIVTIPIGVDTNYYAYSDENMNSEGVISFYGSMSGYANIDALLYFCNDIFPLIKEEIKNARLIVVGSNPSREVLNLAKKNVDITVTGYVKDVRDYLRKSRVSVCPMRVGYGMRGRVLELMSMSIPVVVTKNAIDGMGLQEGHGILIRNETKDFASAVINILLDASLSKEIGLLGKKAVNENYSFSATYDYLAELLYKDSSKEKREIYMTE